MPYGVEQIDATGKITFVNKTLQKIYGYSEDELLSMEIFDLCASKSEREKLRDYFDALIKEQLLPMPYEAKTLTKDGRVIDVEVNWDYKRDQAGRLTGFSSIVADITEQKKIEKELQESERRYKMLFNSSTQGIIIADIDTMKFDYCNPAICKMLGYSTEELTQMGVPDIHPKESLEHVVSEFNAQGRGEKTLAPEIPCLRKDGTIIYADICATKVVTRQS